MFTLLRAVRRLANARANGLRPRRLAVVPVVVILALALVPAVVAGQPSIQALNPPPPDFYTCASNGTGTVCRARIVDTLDPVPAGIECDAASGPFEVIDQATRTVEARRWYDRDGNLVKRVRVNRFDDARLSHPTNGRTVDYRQHDIDTEIFTAPGDLGSATFHSVGSIVAVVPGMGAVIVERGRVEVASDGTLEKLVGRRDLSRYFDGDTAALADLCAALAG